MSSRDLAHLLVCLALVCKLGDARILETSSVRTMATVGCNWRRRACGNFAGFPRLTLPVMLMHPHGSFQPLRLQKPGGLDVASVGLPAGSRADTGGCQPGMRRLLAQPVDGGGSIVRTSVVYGSQRASCDKYDTSSGTWQPTDVKYGK